jgi:hypothetical protein
MRCLVAARLDRGVVVADTSDPIAAELVALAFADLDRPSSAEYTGPWEDQLVQRATELQIGVLLPSAISVELTGHWPDESRQGLGLVLSSIGVSIT